MLKRLTNYGKEFMTSEWVSALVAGMALSAYLGATNYVGFLGMWCLFEITRLYVKLPTYRSTL